MSKFQKGQLVKCVDEKTLTKNGTYLNLTKNKKYVVMNEITTDSDLIKIVDDKGYACYTEQFRFSAAKDSFKLSPRTVDILWMSGIWVGGLLIGFFAGVHYACSFW